MVGRKQKSWMGLILPTLGTAIFIVFANKNIHQFILSSKPFVFIGKISYSLYLWHWPIIQFHKHFNLPSFIVSFIALFTVAFLSYKFIETPLRKNRHSLAIIGTSFFSCACFSIYLSHNKQDNEKYLII